MKKLTVILLSLFATLSAAGQILRVDAPEGRIRQYGRADFSVTLKGSWENPFLQEEAALEMLLTAPSGKTLVVPCFYVEGESGAESRWEARIMPQEKGPYTYCFRYSEGGEAVSTSEEAVFEARRPRRGEHGILHVRDNWTLVYDDGTPFRGIGENLCWESRVKDDNRFFAALHEQHERFNYDAMLPAFAKNGGNFTRFWMCPWNFPIDRHDDFNNDRYEPSDAYYNPSAVARLDHVMALSEELGVRVMLCMGQGDVTADHAFFLSEEARARMRNRLRYIVARWGYSPSVAMWEFFNEIDNIQFYDKENPIPAEDIVAWHTEMAAYLKELDPFDHVVTTSISHRDLAGLNDVPDIDINQKHIYCATETIPSTIHRYEAAHGKPYVIGEYSYEWNWFKNFGEFEAGMVTDFRRGPWYGVFNPTPVTPMSWWWEWFDEKGVNGTFRPVRFVSDRMLCRGKGSFIPVAAEAKGAEAYAVRCGKRTYVYVFSPEGKTVEVRVDYPLRRACVRALDADACRFVRQGCVRAAEGRIAFTADASRDGGVVFEIR